MAAKGEPSKKRPIARALYQFEGQTDLELSFSPGEAILLLKRVDENWLEGELDGQIGIFPKNRVRVEAGSPSLSSESALARSGRPCGVVLNDFKGECEGDLPLEQGQIVELVGSVGSGWTRGRIGKNVGIFPSSFVEVLQPLRTVQRPIPKPRSKLAATAPNSPTNNAGPLLSNGSPQLTSISSLERRLSGLHASLETEEKMRQSAEALLKICQSEEKEEKLTKTLNNHQQKIEKINRQIESLEARRDEILSQQSQSAPSTPPNPRVSQKPVDESLQRERVIKELIQTEKDYHQELSAFCAKVLPSFQKWNEVLWVQLFANIEDVANLSGQLCTALEETVSQSMNGGDHVKDSDGNQSVDVGSIFKNLASEIKEVYGTYCRNHDHASQLLEKIYEDKEMVLKFKEFMDLGKPEVTSWDLHTFLIKPVQRVLKYPLLLGKLLEYTPKSDPHHKLLSTSFKLSSQVAQDINEIKRRKDLLERYTGAGRDERRINFGTMRKKARRLRQTLTQKTGLRSATIDSKYADEETKILSLESALRTFQANITTWMEEGDHLFSCRDALTDTVSDYVTKSSAQSIGKEISGQMKGKWKSHCQTMREVIINPLTTLIGFFHDPLLLMNKRGDKLLDYDSLQYDLEKCTEPDKMQQQQEDVTLAKRTYEALNTQLLEDLPKFSEKVTQAFSSLLVCYLKQELAFHEHMCSALSSLSVPNPLTTESIIETHTESLQQSLQSLCSLSIVPTSLAVSFGIVLMGGKSPSRLPTRSKSVDIGAIGRQQPLRRSVSAQNSDGTVKGYHTRVPSPIYEEIPDRPPPPPHSPPQYNDETTPSYEDYEMPEDVTPTQSDHEYEIPPDADCYQTPPNRSLSPYSEEDSLDISSDALSPLPVSMDSLSPLQTTLDSLSPSPMSLSPLSGPVPNAGTQLLVTYEFIGESDIEISVKEGDTVTLLCPHDQEGSTEWWLVGLGDEPTLRKGYVPSSFFQIID